MRARSLKPGLCKNEVLGKADPINTYVYEGLWMLADRAGRLEDRPERIHAEINPYRPEASTVQALDWLGAKHFIVRYRVNGHAYIWIPTFLDHQNPHVREPPSRIPPVEKADADQGSGNEHGARIVQAPGEHQSGPASSLTPDSPFPIPVLRHKRTKGNGQTTRSPKKRAPPDFDLTEERRQWAAQHCPDIDVEEEFAIFKDYEFGNAHSDWEATLRNWWRRAQRGAKPGTRGKGDPYAGAI